MPSYGKFEGVPYMAMGNDELRQMPKLNKIIKCPHCDKCHRVTDAVGTRYNADGTTTRTVGSLQFYKCSGQLYLAGIKGRAVK